MNKTNAVLFLCTGNYYRSRFAEIYFRYLAETHSKDHLVFSRGLRISGRNPGPISVFAKEYLQQLDILIPEPIPFPELLTQSDFQRADLVIALDKTEHEPMVMNQFPQFYEQVVFWDFPDIDFVPASEILPRLKQKIDHFFEHELEK